MKKVALITGIVGQDGSYLSELLLKKGYDVHGIDRRSSLFNRERIEKTRREARKRGQIYELYYGDISDAGNIYRTISKCKPTEIYNFASQSHVAISFDEPEHTTDINANGVIRLLEAIRNLWLNDCRFYQASTSELFGNAQEVPQNENTPFHPRSPYGVAKLYGYWIVRNYREHYGMHASNGILYNHESPRRGENFVTRKITYSLARIKAGEEFVLELGNIDAKRDWGYAKDYVEMMWMMLQQEKADDYVIATGEIHTVREFAEIAAHVAGFELEWNGEGVDETGIDKKSGKTIVKINPKFYRPVEEYILTGDPSKAREKLGWKPKVSFEELVEIMMKADMERVK
jgi:GDPmannose 4,6-dehydratase